MLLCLVIYGRRYGGYVARSCVAGARGCVAWPGTVFGITRASGSIVGPWTSADDAGSHATYPGEMLGLPESGPGSLAPMGAGLRRCSSTG